MKNQHPLNDVPQIQIVRHANGAAVGAGYDSRRDGCMPTSERIHVFTSFQEMTEFLKGWWPDAGKE